MKRNDPRKVLLVLVDGISDVSYSKEWWLEQLMNSNVSGHHHAKVCKASLLKRLMEEGPEDFTPLQLASCPTLDKLATLGSLGLMDPFRAGFACGSDTAHLSLFGYDPTVYYRGRGAFESMGAGLSMIPGDVAFKCNFAILDEESGVVIRRRADRNFHHIGPAICEALQTALNDAIMMEEHGFSGCSVAIQYATEHRCGIRLRRMECELSDKVTGTDPLSDNLLLLACKPLPGHVDDPDALLTCNLVNYISARLPIIFPSILANLSIETPANIILFRGAGSLVNFPDFPFQQAVAIAPTCIIKGLAKSIGMQVYNGPEMEFATGDYRTDLMQKANAVIGLFDHVLDLDDFFCFLHVKAVDDAGHDGNALLKVFFLEQIDQMISHILHGLSDIRNLTVIVTGDHSTLLSSKDHSNEPVPLVIYRSNQQPKRIRFFNEICAELDGDFNRITGLDLLKLLKQRE